MSGLTFPTGLGLALSFVGLALVVYSLIKRSIDRRAQEKARIRSVREIQELIGQVTEGSKRAAQEAKEKSRATQENIRKYFERYPTRLKPPTDDGDGGPKPAS